MNDLQDILQNTDLGAQELLIEAIAWLQSHPEYLEGLQRDSTLKTLQTDRPSMVGFSVLADRLETGLDQGAEARKLLQEFRTEIETSTARIAQNLYPILQPTAPVRVLTLSYSSTLREVMLNVSDLIGTVHVLESEPGGEGKRLAEDFGKQSIEAVVHPDKNLESLAEVCDLGLIGADTVFPDGSVLNKVLSRHLGEALKERSKPFYVLASRWKHSPESFSPDRLSEPDRKLFERIPSEFISAIVSD
ncbi:MAG: hypothetical protein H6751_15190 [Candidatus Omnitrophica bacterium]|nr:hypothetical protein [Candidatus Omnitrophota bacterium]